MYKGHSKGIVEVLEDILDSVEQQLSEEREARRRQDEGRGCCLRASAARRSASPSGDGGRAWDGAGRPCGRVGGLPGARAGRALARRRSAT